MTNKRFRDDLAKQMRDKYNERNEKLEQAKKSSFSDGLKGQMKKEIMENFDQEMEEMKSRPGYEKARKTHLEEIKARIKLEKNGEIPQDLKDFRKSWLERIERIDDEAKERIIKATEKIKLNVISQEDGSRLIEFNLGGKKWKILDSKLDIHTDLGYVYDDDYDSYHNITNLKKIYVKMGGMLGDNVNDWKNQKLKKYVQQKQKEGLHIPSEKEMKELLVELGGKAKLKEEEDQIAMLMYLTGMDGRYWLEMSGPNWRNMFRCHDDDRTFDLIQIFYSAGLCMISCE